MRTQADKIQNTQTKADPQKQRSGESTFQFEDNRPEAIMQRKLQAMADHSPQVQRLQALQAMANNSPQVRQLQALQEMIDNSPQVQKAAQLAAMFNDRPASIPSQSQPKSTGLQGHLNTPNPPSAAPLKQTGSLSGETTQLEGGPEEEELLQGKFATLQRKGPEEEELLQGKFEAIQRQGPEEEELQMKQGVRTETPVQLEADPAPRTNNTGLPDNLKTGIEMLSGIAMDNVKIHYNSPQPVQLNALAYTQGSDIHVAPGQEQHLPHEAWHVVQQAQGRVKPTVQMAGVAVNDDGGLEHEADVMGARAMGVRGEVAQRVGGGGELPKSGLNFLGSTPPHSTAR